MSNETLTIQRYSNWVIGFHWAMFLLMIGIYISMEFRGIFDRGTAERELMKSAHYIMGITLLLLLVPRLLARIFTLTPAIVPAIPAHTKILSKLMHLALYLFMLAMPVMGWTMINANGKEVVWLGLELPRLVQENKSLARQLHDLHEQGATLGYVLIGLHTLAAIFHHRILKNNVLLRMSPFKK